MKASLLQRVAVLTVDVDVRGTRSSRWRVTVSACVPRVQVSTAPDPGIFTVDSVTFGMLIYAYMGGFLKNVLCHGRSCSLSVVAAARERSDGPATRTRISDVFSTSYTTIP